MVRLMAATARHPSWLVLAIVELLVLSFVCLPFLASNNLLRHDLIGHLDSAAFTSQYLFPGSTGYNPFYYCGVPQNLLYPPLLAYLSAALGHLVAVPLALKIVVVVAVLLTPPAAFWCAYAHGLDRGPSVLATLGIALVLVWCPDELGGTMRSTFEVGNLANALGLPLFLAYAASLAQSSNRLRSLLLPTLLLGLNLIAHLVSGLVALALLSTHAALALQRSRGLGRGAVANFLLHAVGALALSAFFVIPLFVYRRFGSPDNRSYNQYPDSLLLVLTSGAILVALYASNRPERARIAPIGLLSGLLLLGRNFIFNDYFPTGLGLHVHRFKLYDLLLLVILVVWLVRVDRRRWIGRAAVVLSIAGLAIGLGRIDPRGFGDQPSPKLTKLPARVMVLSSAAHQVSDHAVQHLVPLRTGNPVAKGLFIESAANARFLVDLEQLLAADPSEVRTWGVELDAPARLEPLRSEIRQMLALFGFGFVVTNDRLHPDHGLLSMGDVGNGFHLFRANYTSLAEVWTRPIDSIDERQFVTESRRWFFGRHDRLVVALRAEQSWEPSFDARVASTARVLEVDMNAARQSIHLDVEATAPVPILLKFTYMPQFRAFDAAGAALPIYRVTPNFMLVVGRGSMTLRYCVTTLERVTRWISGIALVGLIGGLAQMVVLRRTAPGWRAVSHHG